MQLRLPLFPSGTKMISGCLGIVQYIANGQPIYAHRKDDLNAFCDITGNFIEIHLCRKVDIQRCFHVSEDFVYREPIKSLLNRENQIFWQR